MSYHPAYDKINYFFTNTLTSDFIRSLKPHYLNLVNYI